MIDFTSNEPIPFDSDETEAFYLKLCLLIPEDKLREAVDKLPGKGYKLTLGETGETRGIFWLAWQFDTTSSVMLIRILQVYPELKKRLAL